MKYVTKFETQAAYTAAEGSLILPNVSLIAETNGVSYKPVEPAPSHDFVEIGGIKWATMNVGATGVTDYGLYFQWGDTQGYTAAQVGSGEGQKEFNSGFCDYRFLNGCIDWDAEPDYGLTKYTNADGLTTLQASDDAVTAAWGGSWRMPTTAEFQALGAAVNTAWTNDYQDTGVKGLVCTDKTDSSKVLFFPACGFAEDGGVHDVVSDGFYWSSSLYSVDVGNAWKLYFSSDGASWSNDDVRYYGFAVRGVLGEN